MFGISLNHRSFKRRIKRVKGIETTDVTPEPITRSELEQLFAYELRVATSDILKIKVYGRNERFKSEKTVALGMEHDPSL